MGKKSYGENLRSYVAGVDLQQLFGSHGTVQSVQVIEDRQSGRSKSSGFVEMGSDAEAGRAITALDGQELDGCALAVNEAKPRCAAERLRPALGRLSTSYFAGGIGKWRTTKTFAGPARGRAQARTAVEISRKRKSLSQALPTRTRERASGSWVYESPVHDPLCTSWTTGRASSRPVVVERPGMTPEGQEQTSLMMSRVTAKPEATRRFLVAGKHVRFAPYLPVREHNSDRRRFSRVPFSGAMRWQSRGRAGTAEVLDLSEAGAAFALPQREAVLFGDELSLDIAFGPDVTWQVTRGARVTNIVPRDAEMCRVGVEFPPEQLNGAP